MSVLFRPSGFYERNGRRSGVIAYRCSFVALGTILKVRGGWWVPIPYTVFSYPEAFELSLSITSLSLGLLG